MPDQKIKCKDCGQDFIHTESDQEFFAEKKFQPPKRCKPCRQARRDQPPAQPRDDDDGGGRRSY
jgi:hypothetical protein